MAPIHRARAAAPRDAPPRAIRCDRPRAVPALVFALTALALAGCAQLPTRPGSEPPSSFMASARRGSVEAAGVLIAGWHTGLVLPADELGGLRVLLVHDPGARYVSLGWGNRRFYMAAHPGSGDALAALFPSRSALLVQTFASASDAMPVEGRLEWVCADRAELWRIDTFVRDSLQWRSGRALDLGAGARTQGEFYASSAHYDALHTCNTWTLAALQFAGFPVKAAGVLFAGQAGRRIRTLPMCPPPAG